MAKRRQNVETVLVRPIEVSDFDFIRTLASKTKGYTLPPRYILWTLCRFQGELGAIAEEPGSAPVGYLLALPVGIHSDAIFVWQLATTFRGQRLKAADALAEHVKAKAQQHDIRRVIFTSCTQSATDQSIQSLAARVFHASPAPGVLLPRISFRWRTLT